MNDGELAMVEADSTPSLHFGNGVIWEQKVRMSEVDNSSG
jgi:hypothetical protein